MRINSLSIMSCEALDFELSVARPVTVLRGRHASLALDLIREVLGDRSALCDVNAVDGGHFVIHTDVEIDGKSFSVCYIRNADGDDGNRIAVNFKQGSTEYSEVDTLEFIERCRAMEPTLRPVFIYPSAFGEEGNVRAFMRALSGTGRQVFIAIPEEFSGIDHANVANVLVG